MSIDFEKEFELYAYGESLASQTARLGLAEKGVEYKHHHVFLESKGEHLTADYKRINPKCLVPTLLHSGQPIHDSVKILEHLDEYSPQNGPKLFPSDQALKSEVWALIREFALDEGISLGDNFGTSVALGSSQILARLLCKRPILGVIWDYLTKHPDKQRVPIFLMLRLLGKPPNAIYKRSITGIAKGILFVENVLSHGKDYLVGDYSAADCLLTDLLHRLEDIALHSVLVSNRVPFIRDYWSRVKERKSYKTAILDWELDEWREVKAQLYGREENPETYFFWSEFDRLQSSQSIGG